MRFRGPPGHYKGWAFGCDCIECRTERAVEKVAGKVIWVLEGIKVPLVLLCVAYLLAQVARAVVTAIVNGAQR